MLIVRSRAVGLALLLAAVVLALVAVVALAQRKESLAPPPSRVPTSSVSDDPCASQERIRALVASFLDDYNSGRAGLADRFFAPAPEFMWYSERPLRLGAPAFDRSTLESYLLQRHTEGDRLTLVSMDVSGIRGGIDNFGFVVRRDTADLQSKGALACRSGKFIVWSLGPDPGPT